MPAKKIAASTIVAIIRQSVTAQLRPFIFMPRLLILTRAPFGPKLVEVTVLTEIAQKGDHQAYIGSNLTGPDSSATLRCYYSKTPRTACNYTGFKNDAFDKLFEAAGQEKDPAKRNDLLRQANNLLYDEAPVWFFNYNKAVMAFQPWIHGLQANPTEIPHQYAEDIWVDEKSPVK